MHIQQPTAPGPANGPQATAFPNGGGGDSPGGVAGLRTDWQLKVNLSHSKGFVGGAGRLLIHNEMPDERTSVTFFLPAELSNEPGKLRLLSARVNTAKVGVPATPGQALVVQPGGVKAAVTIPVLRLNDYMYIDITWDGGFPVGGAAWPGGGLPLGMFHPQVAIETETPEGQPALGPVPARYHVSMNTDLGARVRLDGDLGDVKSEPTADGKYTQHDFRSFGSAKILATVFPAGVSS